MHCRTRFDKISGCWSLLRDRLLCVLAKFPDRKYERYIPQDDCWTPFFVEVPFPYAGQEPLLLRPREFRDSDCPLLHVPIALIYYQYQPLFPYGPLPRTYRFWDGIINVPSYTQYVAIQCEGSQSSSKAGTKDTIHRGVQLNARKTPSSPSNQRNDSHGHTTVGCSKVVHGRSLKDVILSEVRILPPNVDISATAGHSEVLIKVEELDDIQLTPLVLVEDPDGTPIVTIYD